MHKNMVCFDFQTYNPLNNVGIISDCQFINVSFRYFILACPIDKHYPLELYEINTVSDPSVNESIIKEGILFCSECSRFYPIMDEIPVMLPDELREKEKDIEFLKTWHDQIPDKIINYGNPWHL